MCYKESTTEMATTQSKYGRRFDEEFKREVAALASKPGAKQEQVARDLGVSPYSVARWKKQYGGSTHAAPLLFLASAWRNWSGAFARWSERTPICVNRGRF